MGKEQEENEHMAGMTVVQREVAGMGNQEMSGLSRSQDQDRDQVFTWRWWQVLHLRAHLVVFLCQQMMPSFVEALAPAAAASDPPMVVRTLSRLSERLARLCPPEHEPARVVEVRLSAQERAALRRMGRVLSARYLAERPSAQRRLALLSLAGCRRLLACPGAPAGDVLRTNSEHGAIRASVSIQAGR